MVNRQILLLHGANLNLLAERNQKIYGSATLELITANVEVDAKSYGYDIVAFQSNHEGVLIDKIHEFRNSAGIIFNPGAFAHYSYAIHDALDIGSAPVIEVHLSNIHARDEWRRTSVIAPNVEGSIVGFGVLGYKLALQALIELNN